MTLDVIAKPRRRFHQSDYARLERDRYDTIEAPLLLAALDDVVTLKGRILEPACGQGHMAAELRHRGFRGCRKRHRHGLESTHSRHSDLRSALDRNSGGVHVDDHEPALFPVAIPRRACQTFAEFVRARRLQPRVVYAPRLHLRQYEAGHPRPASALPWENRDFPSAVDFRIDRLAATRFRLVHLARRAAPGESSAMVDLSRPRNMRGAGRRDDLKGQRKKAGGIA